MVASSFFGAIEEAVTGFNCFAARQIMGNPLRNFPPLLLLVPQATFILQSGRCGTPPPSPNLPAIGSPQKGGQCPVLYNVRATITAVRGDGLVFTATSSFDNQFVGPFTLDARKTSFNPPNQDQYRLSVGVLKGGTYTELEGFNGGGPDPANALVFQSAAFTKLERVDGRPDDCGVSPPVVWPPQFPPIPYPEPDPTDPDRIWPDITINVDFKAFVFSPVITIPVNFGGFKIDADVRIPITIPVDIGGIKIGDVILRPEAEPEYRPNPAPTGGDGPEPPECPETTTIVVPFAVRESCEGSSAELEVLTDSLPPELVGRLIDTKNLALECCGGDSKPIQEPEELLQSGTSPNPAAEQFVTVPADCVSVRLRITSPGSARQISTFGPAGQRKFGSLGYSLEGMSGGGDYVYVYDADTYYPLPPRGKNGRVRLLLASGVAWELYDTGERL